ncbi:MAG: GspH/FimT family pseudopilin [Deltaproteobacteria bacterium]|nr:GspH/FimT family pseudopilin [Deltaproteobacteria bacterium]
MKFLWNSRPCSGTSVSVTQARGFTLFELILVILIISVAAALVGPAIGSRLLQTNIRRTVLQLRSAVEVMRMHAVRSGREEVMVVDPRDNAYWREGGGEPVALSPDSALLSARSRWLRENGQAEFHFYPDGTNSGGAIRVEQGRGSATAYVVVLDPLLGIASIMRDE